LKTETEKKRDLIHLEITNRAQFVFLWFEIAITIIYNKFMD